MGDMADDFRAMRERKQALRRHWYECPNCAVAFGTGTKVAPGHSCRHCRWRAPGKAGDDERAVKAETKRAEPLSRDSILNLAARPDGFRVSWRYRDERLMARCKKLKKAGLLRSQKGKGETIFHVVPQPSEAAHDH